MTTELTNPEVYCAAKPGPDNATSPDTKRSSEKQTKSTPRRKSKSAKAKTKTKTVSKNESKSTSILTTPKTSNISAASTSQEYEIIKELMIAYANWEETVKRHESELKTIRDITGFLDFLGDSVTFGGSGFDIFDRGKGFLSWIQGMALWKVRPLPGAIDPGMDLRNTDGTRLAWTEWLQSLKHPMSEATAYWCRRIYKTFSAEQAKATGYTEMISQVAPSFQPAMKRDREKWKKQNEFDESTGPSPSPPGKDEPIPVETVERTLDNIAGTLERFKSVADAPDLYNDVDESLRILSDQQKRIDGLRRALDEVEKILQATHQKVIKYRDDGVGIAQQKAAQVRNSKEERMGK